MKKYASISAVLVLWAAVILAGCSSPQAVAPRLITDRPRLIADSSIANDLQALADETWRQFLAVFQSRAGCFGDVNLRAAYDLDDRATYDPPTATVTIKVPATAAMLQSGLVHEWAHHIEFQCQAHQRLRPAFLAAQGLPADTPWRPVATADGTLQIVWASVPSEQYAEATIELVLGSRQIPTAAWVSPEAVPVIAAWAAGSDNSALPPLLNQPPTSRYPAPSLP